MTVPAFSANFLNETEQTAAEELTWRALEVLQAYAMYDVDPYLFEAELNMPGMETIDAKKKNDEDDCTLSDSITHLRTKYFDIDDELSGIMQNIVLLVDENGVLQQMTEPGYVSLSVIHKDDVHTVISDRSLDGINPKTTQFIFRMPWHDEGYAIYEGFTLNEEDRIDVVDEEDVDDERGVIVQLHDFIEDIVNIFRAEIANDAEKGASDYMVQNTPTAAAHVAIMNLLDSDSPD